VEAALQAEQVAQVRQEMAAEVHGKPALELTQVKEFRQVFLGPHLNMAAAEMVITQ
jgi:hypothetical protein